MWLYSFALNDTASTLNPPPSSSQAELRAFLTQLAQAGRISEVIDVVMDIISRLRASNDEKTLRLLAALRKRFGRSSEKLTHEQLLLALNEADKAAEAETAPASAPEPEPEPAPEPERAPRKPTGRRALPASLPRRIERYEPTDAQKHCDTCGKDKKCIGHESNELLEFEPAKLVVIEQQRLKFACDTCENGVVIGPVGPKPIEGGLPGPGLLAHVVVSKFKDHLPLYRQSNILGRLGVDIADATLGGWIAEAAKLLREIWERMCAQVLLPIVMAVDDTPIRVLDRDHKDGVKRGHMWCYVGYDCGKPATVAFVYTPTWRGEGPRTFLKDRVGYIQCDGYKGLEDLFGGPVPVRCIKVGCMAHSRRKFHEAFVAKDKRAAAPLRSIQALYAIEDEAREAGLSGEARRLVRDERSRPHVEALRKWLDENTKSINPKSGLGKAITYANNQWASLIVFLHDGDIPIDNNFVENKIRPIALGRRNWLFLGSDASGDNAAIIYSVLAACVLAEVEPEAYLRDVFDQRSKKLPVSRIDELLPAAWKKAQMAKGAAPVV